MRREADRVAGAVGALLALTTSVLVALGVAAAPLLIAVIAPGFSGEKRELTIAARPHPVSRRGLLVLSAWCLGVLNSHRRFLLSYAAPVMWNAAMIATLVTFGDSAPLPRLAVLLAWGSVVGSALQFLVQLPVVLRVAPGLRLALDRASAHVRQVARNFVPVFIGRGVVQISAFVDTLHREPAADRRRHRARQRAAALHAAGQPVRHVGRRRRAAGDGRARAGRRRRTRGASRAARTTASDGSRSSSCRPRSRSWRFGDVIAAALLQTGRFRRDDAVYVWGILAGSALGLLASTLGRLYSSTYYALHDTRTPLGFAVRADWRGDGARLSPRGPCAGRARSCRESGAPPA